jgi:hypothetical protein
MTGGPRLSAATARESGRRAGGGGLGRLVGCSWADGGGLLWRKQAEAETWRGADGLHAAGPQTKMGQNGKGCGIEE